MLPFFTCFSLLNKGHRKFVQKLALSCNFSASLRKNQSKFWEHLFPQILCLHNTSIWLLILELISIFLLWALLIFPVSFPIYFPFFISPFPSSKYSSIEKMIPFTHIHTHWPVLNQMHDDTPALMHRSTRTESKIKISL